MLSNIHEIVGWHNCANMRCQAALSVDHVVMTTTAHMRRFCSVGCIAEGQEATDEFLGQVPIETILAPDGVGLHEAMRQYIDERHPRAEA